MFKKILIKLHRFFFPNYHVVHSEEHEIADYRRTRFQRLWMTSDDSPAPYVLKNNWIAKNCFNLILKIIPINKLKLWHQQTIKHIVLYFEKNKSRFFTGKKFQGVVSLYNGKCITGSTSVVGLCRNRAREGHTVLSSSEMGVVRGNVDRQAVQTVDPIQGIRLTCTRYGFFLLKISGLLSPFSCTCWYM